MNEQKNVNQTFKKIPLECLWDGLVLPDAIYSTDGVAMLIPAGEQITEKMLIRLTGFLDEEQSVTVSAASYETILQKKPYYFTKLQNQLEDRLGYTSLKQSVEHMLKISRNMAHVEQDTANIITESVYDRLLAADSDAIFQCIDVPRPMGEALQRHCLNVAFLNGTMGQWLELSDADIRQLILTGLLHDIGKTKIPSAILNAPRKLTPNEFAIMKNHPVYSVELLSPSIDEPVRIAVRQHHEKMDGSGYPDGLKGDEISFFARITAVSDIYDALVSERVYKEARIPFDVLDDFVNHTPSGIDSSLLQLFVKRMLKHYKKQQIVLSDGSTGQVAYIPPNDISHPIILQGGQPRQVDDKWYCTRIV